MRDEAEPTDIDLVKSFKESKDSKYIGELYKRYSHLGFGVCRKYMKDNSKSEDAAMQIIEKLIEVLPRHEVSNFKSWLGTITRNHCLTHLKKQKIVHSNFEEVNESEFMDSVSDHSLNEEKEIKLQHLERAIGVLDQRQKYCIELFYLDGKSYKEIEHESEFTMKQVKSFIQNGKRKLKIVLEEQNIHEA